MRDLYDMKAMNARRILLHSKMEEYVTGLNNPRVRYINFEDELMQNYDKYSKGIADDPHVKPQEFRKLLITRFPHMANYLASPTAVDVQYKRSYYRGRGEYIRTLYTAFIIALILIAAYLLNKKLNLYDSFKQIVIKKYV